MISSYSARHLYLLFAASGLSLIGTSITWSGIPFYLFKSNNIAFQIGFTFIALQISDFVISVFLNNYIFKYNKKRIYFSSLLISGLILFFMAFADSSHNLSFFSLCFLFLLSSSTGNICKTIWVFEIIKSIYLSDSQRPLALSNLIEIFGKLIGFTLGPFIFFYFGQKAFIIDGISYFIEAAMISIIPAIRIKTHHQPTLGNIFHFIKKYYFYFAISAITQIFFLPQALLTFHILLEKLKVTHELMSYFSASTFIAMISFNLILVKISKYLRPNKIIYTVCCLALCLVCILLLFINNYTIFVSISITFSLFSMPLIIMFNSYLIDDFSQEDLNVFKVIEASVNSFLICLILTVVNLVNIFSAIHLILISLFAFLFTIGRIYYFRLIVNHAQQFSKQ